MRQLAVQWVGVWLLVGMLIFSTSSCQAPGLAGKTAPARASADTSESSIPLEPAPEFTLETIDGSAITLSDLRGRWLLLNFWATWCGPCRDEMPYLASLAETHGDALTVLAINMRERPEQIRAFAAELGIELSILVNPDDATLLAYGVRGLPISFLIAPDGTIARRIVGPMRPGDVALPGGP